MGPKNPGMLLNQAISEKQLLQREFRNTELKMAFDVVSRGSVFCIEFKCSQLHKTSELPAPFGICMFTKQHVITSIFIDLNMGRLTRLPNRKSPPSSNSKQTGALCPWVGPAKSISKARLLMDESGQGNLLVCGLFCAQGLSKPSLTPLTLSSSLHADCPQHLSPIS